MAKSVRVIYCLSSTNLFNADLHATLLILIPSSGFRTDLRLHDSPALKAALDLHPECLWPIFTWDPHYVYQVKGGVNRWQFL